MDNVFRLLPINGRDMNKRTAQINFYLTKTNKREVFIFNVQPLRVFIRYFRSVKRLFYRHKERVGAEGVKA
jgi:hypothetical protein